MDYCTQFSSIYKFQLKFTEVIVTHNTSVCTSFAVTIAIIIIRCSWNATNTVLTE